MTDFFVPATAFGPGSQPQEPDGADPDIMQLPQGMDTYTPPPLPEPEEVADCKEAVGLMESLLEKIRSHHVTKGAATIDLNALDKNNRDLVDQVLGEGEVSIVYRQEGEVRMQESVMAGIWRIKQYDAQGELLDDRVEIGAVPSLVQDAAFKDMQTSLELNAEQLAPGVLNAPPLIAEIQEQLSNFNREGDAHVINLTLLPQTEEDLGFLVNKLGEGRVTILSRGYGNCRITSTATPSVWWVQYFNSQDKSILNTIEIVAVPEVACAAQEDIEDSAIRLAEILEIYQ